MSTITQAALDSSPLFESEYFSENSRAESEYFPTSRRVENFQATIQAIEKAIETADSMRMSLRETIEYLNFSWGESFKFSEVNGNVHVAPREYCERREEPVVAASTLGASLFEAERGPQEKERLIQDAPETLEAAPRPIKEAEGKLEPSERLSVKKRIVQHKEVSSPKPTRESKPRVRPQSRGLGNPDVVNVFDAISKVGHDIDFTPERYEGDFEPTDAPAGSQEKIEILRQRIDKGMPLWHPDDRKDYEGLRGAVHPRNG